MSDNSNAIVLHTGGDYLVPAAPLGTMLATYQAKKDFIEAVLKPGVDFGTIPGAGDKPALFKAGAEKMTSFFSLAPVFEDVTVIEDWTGKDHDGETFLFYRQRCKLYRGDRLIGSAEGSCNSFETKYRYRWVSEQEIPLGMDKSKLRTKDGAISEFTFAIDKAETSGRYGKPAEYWQQFKDAIANGTAVKIMKKTKDRSYEAWQIGATVYRVPNPDVADQANTVLKMAEKRAMVAAVLIATNISDYFTQDIEDYIEGQIVEEEPIKKAPPAKVEQPSQQPTPPPSNLEQAESIPGEATPTGDTPELIYNGIALAKIGKHNYPAQWARLVAAYSRCNQYEADGILQKLRLAQDTKPENVIDALNEYLNAKEGKA